MIKIDKGMYKRAVQMLAYRDAKGKLPYRLLDAKGKETQLVNFLSNLFMLTSSDKLFRDVDKQYAKLREDSERSAESVTNATAPRRRAQMKVVKK